MKAALLVAPGQVRLADVPVPACGPTDLTVRVQVALTCGTDLKAYQRGHPKIAMPGRFGHQFAGVIEQVGDQVRDWQVGQRVVATHTGPCGECYFCRRQQGNLCEHFDDTINLGCFAELVRVPGIIHRCHCFALPDALDYEQAALLEPVACTLHAIRLANPQPDEGALVIGAGAMGLLFVAALRSAGCERVGVMEQNTQRLDGARRFGAEPRLTPAGNNAKAVRDAFGPHGPDLVVECAGTLDAWDAAFALVRPGGRVVLFGGLPAQTGWTMDAGRLHYQQITLISPFHYTTPDVQAAFAFLLRQSIPTRALITDRLELAQIEEAFRRMADGRAVKVALYPGGVPAESSGPARAPITSCEPTGGTTGDWRSSLSAR